MIAIDHAKRLLEIRGFKLDDKLPELSSLLQFLALHPRIYGGSLGGKNVDLKTMQSVLREHGFRLGDDDPVLLMMALNDIALKDLTKKIKPEPTAFVLTVGKLAALGLPLFVAGLVLGGREGIGLGFVTALTLGLGVGLVGGLLFYQGLIAREQVLPAAFAKATVESKSDSDFVWTPEKIMRAGEKMKINSRVLDACKNVLINNESTLVAARKEKIYPNRVEMAIIKLNEWKEQH